MGWKLYHLWSTDWYRNRDLGRKKLLDYVEKSIRKSREEEKRKSEEAKKLAEKRRLEAEKKAEELRLAREREEAEKEAKRKENFNEGYICFDSRRIWRDFSSRKKKGAVMKDFLVITTILCTVLICSSQDPKARSFSLSLIS